MASSTKQRLHETDSDCDSDDKTVFEKKKKPTVKRAYVFKKEFRDKWPCLRKGMKGESFVF